MKALEDDFTAISDGQDLENRIPGPLRIQAAFWASSGLVDLHDSPDALPQLKIPELPGSVLTNGSAFPREKVLQSLRFNDMTDRHEGIAQPYPNTFEWLFAKNSGEVGVGTAVRDLEFLPWLLSRDADIFWITGVPASGKSTLMKFIVTHPDLRNHLQHWAGPHQLLMASFYFWGPGSEMQKSQVGLMRSLLYQILTQRPDLFEAVTPRRRLHFGIMGAGAIIPDWEWAELRKCLERCVSAIQQGNTHRLALFVDGLDEYRGNQEDLVQFLKKLHRQYRIKLCVSSRPENVFVDELSQGLSLQMHHLTQPDIDTYVDGRLGKTPAIQELSEFHPKSIEELMEEIRNRAQGVFLWVVLVVEELRLKSRETPSLSALWEDFNKLPRDLEGLYDSIQVRIGPDKLRIASQLYQLVMEWKRVWNSRIPAIFLWLAVNCRDPVDDPIIYPKPETRLLLIPLLKRLLEGHTKGILQVSDVPRDGHQWTVDFLHRTTYDWLRKDANWINIESAEPPGFQPVLWLLAVLVSHLKFYQSPTKKWDENGLISRILLFSREFPERPELQPSLLRVLEPLDRGLFKPRPLLPVFKDTVWIEWYDITHLKIDFALASAAFSCRQYLHAKLDDILSTESKRKTSRKSNPILQVMNHFLDPAKSPLRSHLEAAILSFGRDGSRNGYGWRRVLISRDDYLDALRLDTIELLLNKGAKPGRRLGKFVAANRGEAYWDLVHLLISHTTLSDLEAFRLEKQRRLPGVKRDRARKEYPNYTIDQF